MLFYHDKFSDNSFSERLQVCLHSIPHDLALAGYLTIIPALLLIVSVWCLNKWPQRLLRGYYLIAALLVAMAFVLNLVLYGYWGFPLDSTPLFYFFSSPKDALASVSFLYVLVGILAVVVIAIVVSFTCPTIKRTVVRRKWTTSFVLLLMTAFLFLPIRGGFSVAVLNTGRVYFSEDMELNHAAVNPLFSFVESLRHQSDFGNMYRFMSAEEADSLTSSMIKTTSDSTVAVLNSSRPDILLIVLESFSSKLMDKVGGLPNVAVNLDTLSTEGILFDHIYANSFRTDRGLVSIISGFPAPPVNSLMKYPAKSQSLPSISKSLKAVGYETEYYYGGDVNFTNMRSYLASQEFGKVMSDVDFPISERLSKWGVHDHLLFQRAIEAIRSDKDNTPTFRVIQTTSSHEPYEVPYHRLENERLNAFAYTDSVVGDFIRQYKLLPQWKNTLVVLIPDHLGAYPENITNTELARYQIPMIWIGGAVSSPQRVNTIGSQHDFAATLLGQLGLDHSVFFFSKDLLDVSAPHFAFFSVPDLFGIVDEDNQLIYDNQLGRTVLDEGNVKGKNLKRGQAYLQRIYDVISNL